MFLLSQFIKKEFSRLLLLYNVAYFSRVASKSRKRNLSVRTAAIRKMYCARQAIWHRSCLRITVDVSQIYVPLSKYPSKVSPDVERFFQAASIFCTRRRKAGMMSGCKLYRGIKRKVSGSRSAQGHFSCCQVDQSRHPPTFLYIFSIFLGFVVLARISRFFILFPRIRRDR